MQHDNLFIKMAIKQWDIQVDRTGKFMDGLTDEGLLNEIAPGKNRIIYLLGHLIAVNDNMHALFGRQRFYAHLDDAFEKNPDRSGLSMPDAGTLRQDWKKSNGQLSSLFGQMTVEDWFSRHTAVSEEDFLKEPFRNKLNVLLNRTGHLAYHLGQMILVK